MYFEEDVPTHATRTSVEIPRNPVSHAEEVDSQISPITESSSSQDFLSLEDTSLPSVDGFPHGVPFLSALPEHYVPTGSRNLAHLRSNVNLQHFQRLRKEWQEGKTGQHGHGRTKPSESQTRELIRRLQEQLQLVHGGGDLPDLVFVQEVDNPGDSTEELDGRYYHHVSELELAFLFKEKCNFKEFLAPLDTHVVNSARDKSMALPRANSESVRQFNVMVVELYKVVFACPQFRDTMEADFLRMINEAWERIQAGTENQPKAGGRNRKKRKIQARRTSESSPEQEQVTLPASQSGGEKSRKGGNGASKRTKTHKTHASAQIVLDNKAGAMKKRPAYTDKPQNLQDVSKQQKPPPALPGEHVVATASVSNEAEAQISLKPKSHPKNSSTGSDDTSTVRPGAEWIDSPVETVFETSRTHMDVEWGEISMSELDETRANYQQPRTPMRKGAFWLLSGITIVSAVALGVVAVGTNRPPPSSTPSLTWPHNCFNTRDDLLSAVDDYLIDPSNSNSSVARAYGWPIGVWCVSRVESFDEVFSATRNPLAETFDESLAGWDTSRARSLFNMFKGAIEFNQDVSSWETGNVTDFSGVFSGALAFNSGLSRWNVSRAATLSGMFDHATSFDQPLVEWDVTRVRDLSFVFASAASFNQDVGSWNVSRATTVESMFEDAISFNQDLSGWDVRNVVDFTNMCRGAEAFDQDLCGWGDVINRESANIRGMFQATACHTELDANLFGSPPGPFCAECRAD